MFIKKALFGIFFLISCQISASQNNIGLDINSQDVEVLASINLDRLNYYTDGTIYQAELSYLRTTDNNFATIGISATNMLQGVEDLSLAFGFKAVFTENFLAFPLYAKAAYMLPLQSRIPPTSLSIGFAYSPPVLSYLDAKNYSEFRLEASMEAISNIHIFTGYRRINTHYESYDTIFNNSFYGGLKINF